MTGRFICVVGPSGVGKDSVMHAMAAAEPRLVPVRRVITRPSDAGGEDFDGVTETQFSAMEAAGKFALSWPAHGLRYGIPLGVGGVLASGHDVLANLSRAQLITARGRFAHTEFIALTASRDVLEKRLLVRGRETVEQVAGRLDRASFALPDGIHAHEIDNSGTLDVTVNAVLDLLYPDRS
ncbi:phosphonate metabolism protein/1,5-bisphosphokinase (PRPP-forming) PhnN [Loktanella sp. D2R18]|uniref:phosphonate metabolism protein/1,5-bisphosphokinase (PRPP-forming) PhnN n=1 Tax=Rhodobacterales TaxID=204455 RepID=UPI000DE990B5|nr:MULTISPECIES: phosphonate metabolism protein/1,5-bisphosphokinase (PRPP-forming) PhnN [Rhodobacterales]MDO6591072.1 phosphonate metabolism protein/1,5-bisphosphokinase (PRPP-forming) PhnN [Yoonia sp. 1_MG-2023]RBW42176.1 phosphonate metabolism protein/1,5-bisphosphokinase (PRPP-forming) PhnN [Loktanella sp. D2R18]